MQLLPTLLRPADRPEVVAAVAPVSADAPAAAGIAPVPATTRLTQRQARAWQHVNRYGFVRRAYEWVAWQGGRCPTVPERRVDAATWEPVLNPMDEPVVWATLSLLRGPRDMTTAGLVRRAMFLDDTVGELFVVWVYGDDGRPSYTVRAKGALEAKARNGRPGYLVRDTPDGSESRGTATWVPAGQVWRHWQPDPEWENLATSSLLGILDDLDHLTAITRMIRRRARSVLTGAHMLWTPSEAHRDKAKDANGNPRPGNPSQLEWDYAHLAAASLDDSDDRNVASVAPRMIHTPAVDGMKDLPPPQILEVPGLDADELEHWREARRAVADALPLTTSNVLAEAEGNHWNEWLGNEEDVELIEDRLRRVLDSLTGAAMRPILRTMAEAGEWDGNPDDWRIGADMDPIRRRPDNSANALEAYDRELIGATAARRELHFAEDDRPTPAEVEDMRAARASRAPAAPEVPVADTQAPPANPVPQEPAAPGAVQASALPVVDDRWALAR